MEKAKQEKDTESLVQFITDPAPTVYANICVVFGSGEDFALTFGLKGIPGKAAVPEARIYMSPLHFKRAVEAMASQIRDYERVNGPIKAGGTPEVIRVMPPTPEASES